MVSKCRSDDSCS